MQKTRSLSTLLLSIAPCLVATSAAAQPTQAPAPAAAPVPANGDLVSLRVLHEKGALTDAEYESAVKELSETSGTRATESTSFVMGKWAATMYGFVEADNIYDTTQSFNDLAGGSLVVRPSNLPGGKVGGDNSRFQMSIRNSRIGWRLKAPTVNGIRTSATLEMDFLGLQFPGTVAGTSEGGFFTSPSFRVRHMYLKAETPIVDVLMGQTWQLFGWQSQYHPNTVEIQGVPGQIYSRTPQVRVSRAFKTDPVTVEAAVALTRPVQRDSGLPELQGGLRLAYNKWTGAQTMGATGNTISPLSVAVTGYLRRASIPELAATPKVTNEKTMSGLAVDGFVPVIPATKENKDNALSLNGEFASGYGSADFYTGLSGGIGFPNIPGSMPAAPFTGADIDNGIVTYDAAGGLHPIQWTSWLVGAQYYVPSMDGRLLLSGNYSHITSSNMHFYGGATSTLDTEDWFDANVIGDLGSGVRLGAEYANFNDQYVDGKHAINHRVQISGFYVF